jgi:hypothetical protein
LISQVRAVSPSKSHTGVEFPLQEAKSVDGIISYLTRKHGGNVHDRGIVTITSKSVQNDDHRSAVRNAADVTSESYFYSKDEPSQWVCWDFGEMRVRATHYTIRSIPLKSWVIESSLDSRAWIAIDRKTNHDLFAPEVDSFAVLNSAECRFIRGLSGHSCLRVVRGSPRMTRVNFQKAMY